MNALALRAVALSSVPAWSAKAWARWFAFRLAGGDVAGFERAVQACEARADRRDRLGFLIRCATRGGRQ